MTGYYAGLSSPEGLDVLRDKYRKKGWSSTKIDRAIRDRSQVGGLDFGLTATIAAVAKAAGEMSVLVFWDDGQASHGSIAEIEPEQLLEKRLSIREGVVVKLRTKRG